MKASELWNIQLNTEIRNVYQSVSKTLDMGDDLKRRLSVPLHTIVGPAFAPGKSLLVIGQETYGWGGDDQTVGSSFLSYESYLGKKTRELIMMEGQGEFLLNGSVSARTANSPFWKACYKVAGVKKMTDLLLTGFAWSNLLACDLDGKSPLRRGAMSGENLAKLINYSKRMLLGPLEIERPKVALLFTGPKYDFIVENYFELDSDWKKNDLRSLPECSDPSENLLEYVKVFHYKEMLFVRTYHPAYLTRRKKDGYLKILDILADTFVNMGVFDKKID